MNDSAAHAEPQGRIVSYNDETVLWSGSPSQWLNFGKYLLWLMVLSVGVGVWVYWYGYGGRALLPQFDPVVAPLGAVFVGWSLFMMMYHWLRLKCHKTTITQNKITVSTGFTVFFRSERYCELSDVVDIEAPAPGILGIVGLGSLLLRTVDSDQPEINLYAIRNRMELRDSLLPLVRRLRVERNANNLLLRS